MKRGINQLHLELSIFKIGREVRAKFASNSFLLKNGIIMKTVSTINVALMIVSVCVAILAVIISVAVVILFVQQDQLLESQNAELKKQIRKLQEQVQQAANPNKKTTRNQLVEILYDEKKTEHALLEPLSETVKKRVPAANERLRRDAALDFVKLEYEAGKRWRDMDLSNAFLSGVDLNFYELKRLKINGALERSDFSNADLRNSSFRNTNLYGSNFKGADLQRADLFGAELEDSAFSGANMNKANLGSVNAVGASFIETQLAGVNFYAANLEGAYFWDSHLEGARFWRAHLEDAAMSRAFLEQAEFREAHMEEIVLSGANLEGASFANARMENADLRGAYLAGANFYGTSLEGAMVDSPDWIKNLRHLDPPVKHFRFDDWSLIKDENDFDGKFFMLRGPVVAKKPAIKISEFSEKNEIGK